MVNIQIEEYGNGGNGGGGSKYAWLTPITNRTQNDVDNAIRILKQNALQNSNYTTDLKGCLNKSDMERMLGNVNFLIQLEKERTNVSRSFIETEVKSGYDKTIRTIFYDMKNRLMGIRWSIEDNIKNKSHKVNITAREIRLIGSLKLDYETMNSIENLTLQLKIFLNNHDKADYNK